MSLYAVSVAVLTGSFMFNVFGVQSQDWFYNFQTDSEALIVHKLACAEELGKDDFGGMLLAGKDPAKFSVSKKEPVCQKDNSKAYVSQFGLQGKVASILYSAMDAVLPLRLSHFLFFLQFLWAIGTAAVLGLFVVWVAQQFNRFTAITVLILLSLSVWVVGYARNLYWATPLLFLPLIATLFYYSPPKRQKPYYIFLGVLSVLFFIRFLNGFEFAPEIILAPVVAMSYLIYQQSSSFKRLIKEGFLVCLVGVVAFLGAFAANFIQTYQYVGNASEARSIIMQRVFDRTSDSGAYAKYVYDGFYITVPAGYAIVNRYIDLPKAQERKPFVLTNMISALNYALLPVVSLPIAFTEPVGMLISSFAFVAALSFLAVWSLCRNRADKFLERKLALRRAMLIGLPASLSWLVLAHSHSFVHAHLSGIIYYLPFMLFAFIALGLWLERAYAPVAVLLQKQSAQKSAKKAARRRT
jgi:hypothetical protein